MRRVVFGKLAQRDVDAIWRYVARDSIDAAEKVVDQVERAIRQLAEQPGAPAPRTGVKPLSSLVRLRLSDHLSLRAENRDGRSSRTRSRRCCAAGPVNWRFSST